MEVAMTNFNINVTRYTQLWNQKIRFKELLELQWWLGQRKAAQSGELAPAPFIHIPTKCHGRYHRGDSTPYGDKRSGDLLPGSPCHLASLPKSRLDILDSSTQCSQVTAHDRTLRK